METNFRNVCMSQWCWCRSHGLVMYAIGAYDGTVDLNSLEVYRSSDGVWSSVAAIQSPTLGPLRHCQNMEFNKVNIITSL